MASAYTTNYNDVEGQGFTFRGTKLLNLLETSKAEYLKVWTTKLTLLENMISLYAREYDGLYAGSAGGIAHIFKNYLGTVYECQYLKFHGRSSYGALHRHMMFLDDILRNGLNIYAPQRDPNGGKISFPFILNILESNLPDRIIIDNDADTEMKQTKMQEPELTPNEVKKLFLEYFRSCFRVDDGKFGQYIYDQITDDALQRAALDAARLHIENAIEPLFKAHNEYTKLGLTPSTGSYKYPVGTVYDYVPISLTFNSDVQNAKVLEEPPVVPVVPTAATAEPEPTPSSSFLSMFW